MENTNGNGRICFNFGDYHILKVNAFFLYISKSSRDYIRTISNKFPLTLKYYSNNSGNWVQYLLKICCNYSSFGIKWVVVLSRNSEKSKNSNILHGWHCNKRDRTYTKQPFCKTNWIVTQMQFLHVHVMHNTIAIVEPLCVHNNCKMWNVERFDRKTHTRARTPHTKTNV